MNAKKLKTKQRRRARRLAEQAWEAIDEDDSQLAVKLIARAVHTISDNPALWFDHGLIAEIDGDDVAAEKSFRAALSLAPDFADVYAQLAALCIRQRRTLEAVKLQEQAVEHEPKREEHARRLSSYRALLPGDTYSPASPQGDASESKPTPSAPLELSTFAARLQQVDWAEIDSDLTQRGFARIPRILDESICESVRGWFSDDELFAKTVEMNRPDFGSGAYRYFQDPVPNLVNGIRSAVYRRIVGIANGWQEFLRSSERFPAEWSAFRERCHAAGQTTPTPILLKYAAGGFNALHRDLRGAVFFPIQLAIVLSRRNAEDDGFVGGDFVFADVPEHRKSRTHAIPADIGDAVLFCTRDRLVSVGGAFGLQPVKHGVTPITAGTRYVLGLPFHEYR